jgi:hypothetical protein
MNKYCCYRDVIDDLNKRGFTNDFVLFGDDLLWIQQKIFIQSTDFSIEECHCSGHPNGKLEDLVVLGILAISKNVKGVLLNHYSYTMPTPNSIISKLHKATIIRKDASSLSFIF